jgi:serine/threonine protein kinase
MDSKCSNLNLNPPMIVGYELLREIGRGGYGTVFLCRRCDSGKFYAAKVVYRNRFENEEPYLRELDGVEKFKTLGRNSEFVLKVADLFENKAEGYFCCVMELADDAIEGRPFNPAIYEARTLKYELEKSGRRQRLPAAKCIEIGLAIANGLQILHSERLVHRDVKPSNIIFVNGVPKLADIGLVTDHEGTLTIYTPQAYSAPEPKHAARADIYSFGKVLYEMCTGLPVERFPSLPTGFKDWEDHALRLQINKIVAKASAVELRERHASFADLIEDLVALRDGRPVKSRPAISRMTIFAGILGIACVIAWIAMHSGKEPAASTTNSLQLEKAPKQNPVVPSVISLVKVPLSGSRLPVPSLSERTKARQAVMAATKMPMAGANLSERQAFVSSLVQGINQIHAPAEIHAQLEWAKDLAVADADHIAGLKICDELSRRFAINAWQINEMKAGVIVGTLQSANSPATCTRIGEAATRLGFKFLAMDDYSGASIMSKTASAAMARADDPLLAMDATFLERELNRGNAWFRKITNYLPILESNPTDPMAATECGKYLCFAKNAWPKGLALLAKGKGPLAEAARQDVAGLGSPTNQQSVGDFWWNLAAHVPVSERQYYLQRAVYWYENALAIEPNSDARRALLQRREQFLKEYPPTAGSLRISAKTGANATLVITSQQISLTSSQGADEVHVNWYRWGNFKPGGPEYYPNNGETRYLPAEADLSRALLAKQHISDHSGKIEKFSASPGRVEIELVQSATNSALFELEISF